MVSREKKRAALDEKLQALRSITNSCALDETGIVGDASQYIRELKDMVERLSRDVSVGESSSGQPRLPVVNVETLEKGFLIHVFSDKSCPGLLVLILETFEELGLDVTEARVCCSDNFQLQAYGGENREKGEGEAIDHRVIEKAVARAVKSWAESK